MFNRQRANGLCYLRHCIMNMRRSLNNQNRLTHICISKLLTCLTPGHYLIQSLHIINRALENISQIQIKLKLLLNKKMNWKMPSTTWRLFYVGMKVFTKPCCVPYARHPALGLVPQWRLPGAQSVWKTPSRGTYQLQAPLIWTYMNICIFTIINWTKLINTTPKGLYYIGRHCWACCFGI